MTSKQNYYEILGVSENASDEEIKSVQKTCTSISSDRNSNAAAEENSRK